MQDSSYWIPAETAENFKQYIRFPSAWRVPLRHSVFTPGMYHSGKDTLDSLYRKAIRDSLYGKAIRDSLYGKAIRHGFTGRISAAAVFAYTARLWYIENNYGLMTGKQE